MEPQKILNRQSNLEKKEQTEGITLPNFRLYCKATVIKTAQYQNKIYTQINGTEQRAQK